MNKLQTESLREVKQLLSDIKIRSVDERNYDSMLQLKTAVRVKREDDELDRVKLFRVQKWIDALLEDMK